MSSPEEEEDRREAAMASTPSLQPDFKPRGVSHYQLSKFQELHRRRLQIKSKTKYKLQKKAKNGTGKFHVNNLNTKDCAEKDGSVTAVDDSSLSNPKSYTDKSSYSVQQNNVTSYLASKKPQKLHWGLDTKERWERKANM